MNEHPLISIDPRVMVGKPCIKGTRLPVYHVLRYLGGGMTPEQYVAEFPSATIEGVHAALAYAGDLLEDYRIVASEQLAG
ncbi:MAG: DUF433 domain-containing protein [Candidatus Sumerlaeaceae bacterium]